MKLKICPCCGHEIPPDAPSVRPAAADVICDRCKNRAEFVIHGHALCRDHWLREITTGKGLHGLRPLDPGHENEGGSS
jgi:hypothetical protein